MAEQKETRILVGTVEHPARFSYIAFHEPKESENDDGDTVKKYGCQVIINKQDKETLAKIEKAVQAAIAEEFGSKKPANLKLPLRDGDQEWEEKGEHLKGCYFFNCSSKQRPSVVGTEKDEFTQKLKPLEASEIKSGDYGRITVNFFGYVGKSKGVGAGLGNIQKLKDGDPLGSQRSADDDFSDLDEGFAD